VDLNAGFGGRVGNGDGYKKFVCEILVEKATRKGEGKT
jgi:hypothetical protein